jgi:hypothetical protein
MTEIFRFSHPVIDRDYVWYFTDGLLEFDSEEKGLNNTGNVGELLYRFLVFGDLDKEGRPRGNLDFSGPSILIKSYLGRMFEKLDVKKEHRQGFVINRRGQGYKWIASSPINPAPKPIVRDATLIRLKTLSETFAKEAGFLGQETDSKGIKRDFRLNLSLFVKRKLKLQGASVPAEDWFSQFLSNIESSIGIIRGSAGYGKTSLLWYLYQKSRDTEKDREVWFLKADALSFQNQTGVVTFQELIESVKQLEEYGRGALLFLDTLDLILHNKVSRYKLIELFGELEKLNCKVVATCRDHEASLLAPSGYTMLSLPHYDDDELDQAIKKYSEHFDLLKMGKVGHKLIEDLEEAKAHGRGLVEVCVNPLTLRMLFTIYAPGWLPPNLNTFSLYDLFWERRVEQDFRPDIPLTHEEQDDLTQVTIGIAVIMLIRGTVEAPISLPLQKRFSLHSHEMKKLISRGVIHRTATGYRFFHQTFFEHAAARALLNRFQRLAFGKIFTRIKPDQHILFYEPILEHFLLIASLDSFFKDQTLEYTKMLLVGEYRSATSGLWVYTHGSPILDDMRQIVSRIISANNDMELAKNFIDFAHNMPPSRHATMLQGLSDAWQQGNTGVQVKVLKLLPRIVLRKPRDTFEYIQDQQIVDAILKSKDHHFPTMFAKTLEALIRRGVEAAIPIFMRLIRNFARRKKIYLNCLETMGELIPVIKEPRLLHDLEAVIGLTGFRFGKMGSQEQVSAWARLWQAQWTVNQVSLDEIFQELALMVDELRTKKERNYLIKTKVHCRAYALPAYIQEIGDKEGVHQLCIFFEEHNYQPLREIWANLVFTQYINWGMEKAVTTRTMIIWMMNHYHHWLSHDPQNRNHPGKWVMVAFKSSFMEPRFISHWLSKDYWRSAEPWANNNHLSAVLAPAITSEHPKAILIWEKILAGDRPAYLSPLLTRLIHYIKFAPWLSRDLFFVAEQDSNGILLEAVIRQPEASAKLKSYRRRLDEFKKGSWLSQLPESLVSPAGQMPT